MEDIVLPAGTYYLGDLSQLLLSDIYEAWKRRELITPWCFATIVMTPGIYSDDNNYDSNYEVTSGDVGLVAFPLVEVAEVVEVVDDYISIALHTFSSPVHFHGTTDELILTSGGNVHLYRKL
jgi:hypothetical protein